MRAKEGRAEATEGSFNTQADGCGLSPAAGPARHVVLCGHRSVFSSPPGRRMFRLLTFFHEPSLLVMPFTLLSASSTWTWVSLQNQDFFNSDPEWGAELFCDQRMLLYELLYSVELFALLCALLFLTADPAPVAYIIVYSMLMTFLLLFFCSHSRQPKNTHAADNAIGMLIFATLSSLVSFFVVQHWSGPCPTKRSSGLLLVFVVLTLAILHSSAREETRAGSIILLRTVVSFTCSLYFVLLVGQNPNAWCS